jgi:hypothetical protein
MFVEKYVHAVNSSDLRDDEHHSATHVLMAAALADLGGGSDILGSLLARVKYADGIVHKSFEAGSANLATLLRIWKAEVHKKGRERRWLPIVNAWDIPAALSLYDKVAEESLAQWLDGNCHTCRGAKVTRDRRMCTCCFGSGKAPIIGGRLVAERTKDMVSDLEGMFQKHGGRAAAKMRRAA